jgi:hypothetical protein
MPTTPLPDNLRRLIQAELAAGESLRLVVQPIPARRARALALGVLFFMALWTAGVSCLVGCAIPAGGHFDFGPLEGVRAVLRLNPEARLTRTLLYPGVLFGLGCMLVLPLLAMPSAIRRARQTAYVVTDRRALVVESGRVCSYAPSQLQSLELSEKVDGPGTIRFGKEVWLDGDGLAQQAGFFDVPDVQGVGRVLRELALPSGAGLG